MKLILAEGGSASSLSCDVTDPCEVGEVFRHTLAHHGHVDVVVNAVGMFAPTPVFESDPEVVARLIDVNLAGGIRVCLAAIEAMRDAGGVFVAVTSTQAVLAEANSPVYAATKAGLGHFVASLARPVLQARHPGRRGCAWSDSHAHARQP
ncbi:MAG: SDR family oxidoreductase [Hyphomicrobiales bacterium]|nr:MAG: SDR family oxidoreductase [Hyphomicrobiales bacterium]